MKWVIDFSLLMITPKYKSFGFVKLSVILWVCNSGFWFYFRKKVNFSGQLIISIYNYIAVICSRKANLYVILCSVITYHFLSYMNLFLAILELAPFLIILAVQNKFSFNLDIKLVLFSIAKYSKVKF